MDLVFESEGLFRFFDYNISHKQLLIRSEGFDRQSNIDLVFEGTDFVNCPTTFIGVKVYQLNQMEIQTRKLQIQNTFQRVFLLIVDKQEFYIKTGILRIYKNTLSVNQSSIDMTGNGQENLIWMSTNNF